VRLPDSWTERFPFLDALEEDWDPVPGWALAAWLAFYALFLYQAARGQGLLLMIDLVFIPIHEGGHLFFSYFGRALHVAGGTILQLLAPLLLAGYFAFRRQAQGTAFCIFFFFEQFLPVATYMADARAQELPLLTVGNPEFVEHDWYVMFGALGLLEHDTQIASAVRFAGWLGMLSTVGWLIWRKIANPAVPVGPASKNERGGEF
jgi:hypothetical protein